MRSFKDEAIVLKKIDFGEADRIVTLMTKNHGKVKVLAKGVRRPASRKGGNLDVLNHVEVFVAKGRNLDLVTQAQALNVHNGVKKEVKLISKALYLCELTDGLCAEEQVLPFVFDLLTSTLYDFHFGSTAKLWEFEFQLLNHLGFINQSQKPHRKSLKSFVEEVIERELKAPIFYHAALALDKSHSL